jgi:hypothetical protein
MNINVTSWFIIHIILITFLSYDLKSQQLTTPVIIHLPIMLKSLEYDRNLSNIKNSTIRIGIIYQEQFRASLNTKNQIDSYISTKKVLKLSEYSLEFVPINLTNLSTIQEFLQDQNIDFAYITPLRAINVEKLAQILKNNKILALTGVVEYLNHNIPFSVDVVGDNPKIVIDLKTSRLSGTNFSTNLLKLARVINSNETE